MTNIRMETDFVRNAVVTVLIPAASSAPLTEIMEDLVDLKQRDHLYFGM